MLAIKDRTNKQRLLAKDSYAIARDTDFLFMGKKRKLQETGYMSSSLARRVTELFKGDSPLEGSVQQEETNYQEVRALRARIAELEQIQQEHNLALHQEKEARKTLETRLHMLLNEREHLMEELTEAQDNVHALLDTNQRMDEFLGIASHELRTPLTTINGNIQLPKQRSTCLSPRPRKKLRSRFKTLAQAYRPRSRLSSGNASTASRALACKMALA